jgi:hypothetical protein
MKLLGVELQRFLDNIYIPTKAKYIPRRSTCSRWALLRDVFSLSFWIFQNDFPSRNFAASLIPKNIIGVHKSILGYASTVDKFSATPPIS